MTPATPTYLDAMLRRYGNDLYRLALLLTNHPREAEASLLRAAHQLASAPNDPHDEFALIGALVAALGAERRAAGWLPPAAPGDAALLRGLMRLPRPQRLALSLLTLHDATQQQLADLLGTGAEEARTLVREGLLALAPLAALAAPESGDLAALLTPPTDDLPESCQAARAALGLTMAAPPDDPAVRGHMALCASCRAVAHAWQDTRARLADSLRRTLRTVEMPRTLARRLAALLSGGPSSPLHRRLRIDQPLARRAAVPLAVLLVIAVLVLPRPQPSAPTAAPAASGPALPPQELVARALSTLYAPPQGQGLWHGRWEIRWSFTDGSYAPLRAELWRADGDAQHRAQLTHQLGGGPYEFELASGDGRTSYAVAEKYAPSIYPLVFDSARSAVQITLTPEQSRSMLQARLESGAWALAGNYLRQAKAADELRSLGRQPAADGRRLDVLGFQGTSPLLPPASTPASSAPPVTILLSIDPAGGQLHQIDELHGPPGGVQTRRVVWRFLGGEWLEAQDASAALELGTAWNGHGAFAPQEHLLDPALPLVPPQHFQPASQLVGLETLRIPTRAPAGVTSAQALHLPSREPEALVPLDTLLFYTGPDRRMALLSSVRPRARSPWLGAELVKFDEHRQAALQFGPGQQYRAAMDIAAPDLLEPNYIMVIEASAFGFSREELLAVLESAGTLALDDYLGQAQLFNRELARDPGLAEALRSTLAVRATPPGQAGHTVERLSFRRDSAADQLPDPYHRPRYDGYPAEFIRETWRRGRPRATETTVDRDEGGTIYSRSYTGPEVTWQYSPSSDTLAVFTEQEPHVPPLDRGQRLAIQMLGCAGARLETQPNGQRIISQTESDWVGHSCTLPNYSGAWLHQTNGGTISDPAQWTPDIPYLAGLEGGPLSVRLEIGPAGDVVSYTVYAGISGDGAVVERWEKLRDELLPIDQVPADVFDQTPPAATLVLDDKGGYTLAPTRSTTLEAAKRSADSPLFTLPEEDGGLMLIEVAARQGQSGMLYTKVGPQGALESGVAVRFTYSIGQSEWLRVYQGEAARFRAYLRTGIFWLDSQARTLALDGREVPAWRVITIDGSRWLLAEIDGTLLAIEARTDTQLATAAQLRRE